MMYVRNRQMFLYELMRFVPVNSVCVELGVLYGDFSKMILDTLKPKRLILVDPYTTNTERRYGKDINELPTAYSTEEDYQTAKKKFEYEITYGPIELIREYSYKVVNLIANNSIDFIYHDACHLYKDVKGDLQDWLPKMKEDGLICGHDYIENYKLEVIQAVDEFCAEHNFEMIIFNENGGDYALKRIS